MSAVDYHATSALSPNDRTVTVTVWSCLLVCVNLGGSGSGTMTYTPAANLHDAAGNAAAGSFIFSGKLF